MFIQPIDYFVAAWLTVALLCATYVAVDQFLGFSIILTNLEKGFYPKHLPESNGLTARSVSQPLQGLTAERLLFWSPD